VRARSHVLRRLELRDQLHELLVRKYAPRHVQLGVVQDHCRQQRRPRARRLLRRGVLGRVRRLLHVLWPGRV
jgi:hypothetical protein